MELEEQIMKATTVVEMLVTYISLGWAYVMLTNNDIFEQSNNFEVLKSIAHKEWVIGFICLAMALIKITGMMLKNTKIRWVGLIFSSIFWTLVSAAFLLSANKFDLNTGFVVYSGLAVMCLWTSKEVIDSHGAEQ